MTRRRIPPDQLPELGEWEEPIHGELGVLAVDENDQVQCHVCGRWFRYLSAHLLKGHQIHPEEYRALFGLRASTSLMAPGLREVFRRVHEPQLRPQWARAAEMGRSLPSEQRTAYTRGRRWALEALRDPRNVELHQRTIVRAQEGAARARAEGRRWWRDAREIAPLGRARLGELVADPEWKAAWAAKISAAHGGRTPVPCLACGQPFVSLTGRKTCSPDCERERRRANAPKPGQPEVRAKISAAARRRGRPDGEKLRALAPAAFDRLGEPDRAITRLYYGLQDGRPWTRRELAARFGVTTGVVKETVARSIAYLLGRGAEA